MAGLCGSVHTHANTSFLCPCPRPLCSAQDFEKAGSLRDREMELKNQISAITSSAKEAQVGCWMTHLLLSCAWLWWCHCLTLRAAADGTLENPTIKLRLAC